MTAIVRGHVSCHSPAADEASGRLVNSGPACSELLVDPGHHVAELPPTIFGPSDPCLPGACGRSSRCRPWFSPMNSLANSPDWISPRISFIAARESSPITRFAAGQVTVLGGVEIE